jgi:hypothetical protein
MNIWNSSGSAYWSHSPTISAAVAPSASSAAYSVLHAGDVVGASSIWSRTAGAMTTFKAGVDGYLGVSFDCSSIGGTTCSAMPTSRPRRRRGPPRCWSTPATTRAGADITIGAGAGGAPSVTKAFSPDAGARQCRQHRDDHVDESECGGGDVDRSAGRYPAVGPGRDRGFDHLRGQRQLHLGYDHAGFGRNDSAGSCKITATVHSAAESTYVNTIPRRLQTSAGSNAADASASLIVSNTLPFPQPYCSVTFPSNVEPITRVALTGIDNPSDATVNGTPALENFLSVAGGALSRTGVYGATVEGNTDGPYREDHGVHRLEPERHVRCG